MSYSRDRIELYCDCCILGIKKLAGLQHLRKLVVDLLEEKDELRIFMNNKAEDAFPSLESIEFPSSQVCRGSSELTRNDGEEEWKFTS